MKKLVFTFCLLSINLTLLFSQESHPAFWESLLNNDRVAAEKELERSKDQIDIKSLVLNEILRVENGKLKTNDAFLKGFLQNDDFEYYLYALWNEAYIFDTYHDTGLNGRNMGRLKTISQVQFKNTAVKYAIDYLNSVVARSNNDWDRYFELNDQIEVIKEWQYCGVFENLNESGLDSTYAPEEMAISETPFDAKSNGYVNWYVAKNEREAYQFFSNHDEYGSGVNYAQTFMSSESDQRVNLRIGCGSAFKMWLNDVLIYENTEDVTTDLNAYQVAVTIPQGTNRLLIKTAESNYGSYFIVGTLDNNNNPVTDLSYSSTYSAYNKSTEDQIFPEKVANEFEVFFENKLRENPNDFFYAYCLSNTYLRNSKHEEAKKVITPFYEKYPKSSLIRKMLTSIYGLEGDDASIKEMTDNIELEDPNYYLPLVKDWRLSSPSTFESG